MSKQEIYNNENEELLNERQKLPNENEELHNEDEDLLEEDSDENEDTHEGEKGNTRKRLMDTLQIDADINASSLKELLGSIKLNGEWFRKNMLFFFVLTGCLLGFVTNRYQAQQEMIEEAELKQELAEMRYIWLTRFSELTTAQRQSQIEERLKQLGDSTLRLSKEAPFIIKVDK